MNSNHITNRWDDNTAAELSDDLALRVYTSRLLGQDKTLVLHGGGNTSVKISETSITGEREEILYVKGSGWDLETIEAEGFSPVRLQHLIKLADLETLSDIDMVNELRTHMTLASAPTPSVEAILHATIPYKFVDHTHADAVVSITNTLDGEARIREIYGDEVVIIPYVMPGFDLARLCAERFRQEATDKTIGMILMNHGVFSFGDNAKSSYERMIDLVSRAKQYLCHHNAWQTDIKQQSQSEIEIEALAELRHQASKAAGVPMLLSSQNEEKSRAFSQREDLDRITQSGPATPDHVIRTKRLPQLGRDIIDYSSAYTTYFEAHAPQANEPKTILDTCPRVIIDPELGVCTLGRSGKESDIVADIYRHTIDIILRAEKLGGYQALPASDIFDVEYWSLEQAKLKKAGSPPPLSGEVVFITGAASGIGKACVDAFLKKGAAVIGIDINDTITELSNSANYIGITCDITSAEQLEAALNTGISRFGGIDMLVLNAGIFPPGSRIDSLSDELWSKVMTLNLDANLRIMRRCHPLLRRAYRGGRVVVIGSKNIAAPGPGAAAYSASKAALSQLARVAALEWSEDNIRINSIHPDAVFDTAIWSEEVLASRASHYAMSVEEYKKKNLLRVEINSADVAVLAAEMCDTLFSKITGAHIPLDGGNDRVI